MKKPIKTIEVQGKEWFDKVNGNSYCAGAVTVHYSANDSETFEFSYQYGYGDYYLQAANNLLASEGIINTERYPHGGRVPLWKYCDDNGIILVRCKQTGCKKAELMEYGKEVA